MLGDQAYQNALRRRDQLQQEMELCRAQLEQIDAFLELCAHFAGIGDGSDQRPLPATSAKLLARSSDGRARRRLTTVSGMLLVPHARKAILEMGKPLQRGALVRALEERGIRVGGKGKPANNIGTVMWRAVEREEFVNLPRLGYWPRDVSYEPAGYAPATPPAPQDHEDAKDEAAEGDLWHASRPAA